MPTPAPSVDTLPPAPVRGQAGFSAATGLFLEALPDFGEQVDAAGQAAQQNAAEAFTSAEDAEGFSVASATSASNAEAFAAVAIGATSYVTTSGSNVTAALGTRTFALDSAVAAKMATAGSIVTAIRFGDPETRVSGEVQGGSTTTNLILDVLAAGVSAPNGSGPYTDWFVMLGVIGGVGATKADMLAVETSQAAVTPLAIREALEPYALTDGATVTPSGANGLDFTWTIGGNRTLGAITNTYPGATGSIKITQDGTGSRVLAWASSVYKRRGGLPVLSTPATSIDWIEYKVRAVDGSDVATDVTVNFIKAPTN